jgi:D-3-phosphoglycerate dehydrogenase
LKDLTPGLLPAHVALVSREELLPEADFLSLHVPLTPGTRGLIGKAALRWMRSSAILVNTSRGPAADEPALVEALRDNRLAGAALDVFTEEPLPVSSPLRSLPNVVLTPHYAARSEESILELRSTEAASVEALVRGYWPPYPANPTVSPRIPLQPWTEFHL